MVNFSASRLRRANAPRRIRARRDSCGVPSTASTDSSSSSYSSSSTQVSSRRVRLLANVRIFSNQPPSFSAMLTHDQPVNSVKPAAQIHNSASVPPLLCSKGCSVVLSRLPITPPEAKYQMSSALIAASPQDVRISAKTPIIRSETAK